VDDIVIAMERVCDEGKSVATTRIGGASPEELDRWMTAPEKLPDEAQIVQHLDALLLTAMRESGTQSVNESLDALKGRERLVRRSKARMESGKEK